MTIANNSGYYLLNVYYKLSTMLNISFVLSPYKETYWMSIIIIPILQMILRIGYDRDKIQVYVVTLGYTSVLRTKNMLSACPSIYFL